MTEFYGTRFFISPNLSDRRQRTARSRALKAGGCVVSPLTRDVDYVVTTAAECRAMTAGKQRRRGRQPTYLTLAALEQLLIGSMVIALENGVEHVLDFSTGQLHSRFPSEVAAMPALSEAEVTRDNIEAILTAAGITTTRDSDGNIVAHAFGHSADVLISSDRRFIRFLGLVGVWPTVTEEVRISVVTRFNQEYDVVRFRLWEDSAIGGDYAMPYVNGIQPTQLVAMLTGFMWVMKTALESEIAAELLG